MNADLTANGEPSIMSIPSTNLLPALQAIDRLNSDVRSRDFSSHYVLESSHVRKHVYAMKKQAIQQAHSAGLTTHRRVSIRVQCRDCGGTGQYVNWDGFTFPHCHACSSKGEVTLRFVETTIKGVGAWHTPDDRFPHALVVAIAWPRLTEISDSCTETWRASWTDVTGQWTTNQPGRALDPAESAQYLVTAEAAFYWPLFQTARQWKVDLLRQQGAFNLYLGAYSDACYFCHTPHHHDRERNTCNTINWRIRHKGTPAQWRIRACDPCSKIHEPAWKDNSLLPFPTDLAAPTPIHDWLRTHTSLPSQPSI